MIVKTSSSNLNVQAAFNDERMDDDISANKQQQQQQDLWGSSGID